MMHTYYPPELAIGQTYHQYARSHTDGHKFSAVKWNVNEKLVYNNGVFFLGVCVCVFGQREIISAARIVVMRRFIMVNFVRDLNDLLLVEILEYIISK